MELWGVVDGDWEHWSYGENVLVERACCWEWKEACGGGSGGGMSWHASSLYYVPACK